MYCREWTRSTHRMASNVLQGCWCHLELFSIDFTLYLIFASTFSVIGLPWIGTYLLVFCILSNCQVGRSWNGFPWNLFIVLLYLRHENKTENVLSTFYLWFNGICWFTTKQFSHTSNEKFMSHIFIVHNLYCTFVLGFKWMLILFLFCFSFCLNKVLLPKPHPHPWPRFLNVGA